MWTAVRRPARVRQLSTGAAAHWLEHPRQARARASALRGRRRPAAARLDTPPPACGSRAGSADASFGPLDVDRGLVVEHLDDELGQPAPARALEPVRGVERDPARAGLVDRQPEEGLGLELVGLGRLHGSSGWWSTATIAPAFCSDLADLVGDDARPPASPTRDPPTVQPRGSAGGARAPAHLRRWRRRPGSPRRSNSADDVGAADAVGGQPGVALEVLERRLGGGPEDAVDPAGVEAERAEAALELGDVVAPQHRRGEVEEAVTRAGSRPRRARPRSVHRRCR